MGKGIKTSRLSEERWDVSWTEKFLRFPETRPGRARGRIVGENDSISH